MFYSIVQLAIIYIIKWDTYKFTCILKKLITYFLLAKMGDFYE